MQTRFWKYILFVALLGAIIPSIAVQSALGQSQSINGTIRGTVMDSTGAVLPGATLTITNLATGFSRQTKSGSDGAYVLPNLPVGAYSVLAENTGFASLTQKGVSVEAGSSVTVDVSLKTGSVATQILVVGDAPILEPSRLDLSRTISAEETQNLPLSSRNPYNFILFQPGISGHPNAENGIPRTVDTNGLVDRVNYQLDGMVDTETDRYGLRLFAISDSYVSEIQTISNSYSPEFGNTAGVIFNVITGSGTNNYHGTADYIWRPEAASSCPILANCDITAAGGKPKPSLHVDDVLGNVGGPVVKDKLFFYAAYEHLRRSYPVPNTVTSSNVTALEALGVSASDFNTAPSVQHAQWFDTRIDAAINKKNQVFIRYNYFRNVYPFNTNVGGQYNISAASDFQDRAHIIGAQWVTTFSPSLFNEFRGSWPYRNEHHVADALTGAGPMVTITGVANFGGSNGVGDKYQEKIPSFSDNVTFIKGKHSMKFGFGMQQNLDTQLADIYTQYTFRSVLEYTDAKANSPAGSNQIYAKVSASIGNPGAAYHSLFFDLFGQDAWQIRKNLLVTYGVRYDQYRAPTPPANEPFFYTNSFRTPEGNFSPRLGLSYQPYAKTVVRLNAGIFYEATPTNTWYNPLYNNGAAGTGSFIATIGGVTSNPGICQLAFPNSPQNVSAGCISTQSIYALNPKFKNEYVWNGNLQFAQQIAKNDSLTVGYILTNGRNMQFLRNMNLINPTSYLADGRPVYSNLVNSATRAYSQFNNITLEDIGSNSSYNALTATYEHRLSAGLTTSASYTWAHAISNTPEGNTYEFSTLVEDTSNPKRDRGNSGINRPNAFTVSLVYQPNTHFDNRILNGAIKNNTFAILGNMSTGDEQSITASTSPLNGDALATSRPLYVGRNTVRTPAIYQYDMRYTRTLATLFHKVQPKLLVEANNLLNRSNVTSINTTAKTDVTGAILTAPTFKPTTTLLEARIIQFGLKIDF
jgi:hypothetical protein